MLIMSESGVWTMLRLTILLCAGLYATLLIGGADRGQKRMGLVEAEQEAALLAEQQSAALLQTELVSNEAAVRAPEPQAARLISVAFSSNDPVISPAALSARPEEPVAAAAPVPVVEAVFAEDSAAEVMFVTGRSVNVRFGPSTGEDVIARLARGEAVTIVERQDNGWARIRIEGDGVEGFMSLDFLSDVAP